MKIKDIKAREIIDSRGNPTLQVYLQTEEGVFVSSCPSGASTGKYEAVEIRDEGERFNGKGVTKAVESVENEIKSALVGKEVNGFKEVDKVLKEIDSTENKSQLGVNAILPVSMAAARAEARDKGTSLVKILGGGENMPRPCFNILNGGRHAGNDLDIQEFMVVPKESSFKENLRVGAEIYHRLGELVSSVGVGDEGGFSPNIGSSEEALNLVMKAIGDRDADIGIDAAASEFFNEAEEVYELEGEKMRVPELHRFYKELIENYPIIFIEDPFAQDDWEAFSSLLKEETGISVVGDDLTVTNPERINQAKEKEAVNGIILKPNQIGSVSESLEAADLAKKFGWQIITSHRSGETCDDFIADLAVGISSPFIKSGAPARGERTAKYNRLLEIGSDKNGSMV